MLEYFLYRFSLPTFCASNPPVSGPGAVIVIFTAVRIGLLADNGDIISLLTPFSRSPSHCWWHWGEECGGWGGGYKMLCIALGVRKTLLQNYKKKACYDYVDITFRMAKYIMNVYAIQHGLRAWFERQL